MKFSACWITKNEEKNILRSIESLKDVVDELVVVDTGSTDNTTQIAEEAGARIDFFEWTGDFAEARNYALSQVTGDIVFFLDADEWFSPTLTSDERHMIEKIFSENEGLDTIQMAIHNYNDQGAVKTTNTVNRIFRPKEGSRYINKVHERYVTKNDAAPLAVFWKGVHIDHCGYVESIMSAKMARNIALLESTADNNDNPEESHLQHCYLVREYFQNDDTANSLRHFKITLERPELIKRHCAKFRHGFTPILYQMLMLSSDGSVRGSVSREELYRKVVGAFKNTLRDYPGTESIDLFFDSLFDFRDDLLLSRLAPTLAAAAKYPETQVSYYREAEAIIYQKAAAAALRRGRPTEAMDHSVASFKHTQSKNPSALHTLLCCMRGIEAGDIIVFLNSQFNLGDPSKLEFLSNGTRLHGFKDVHAYYLDKRIKAGLATKEDYLYLLLLYGHFTQAAKAARELHNDVVAGVVAKSIFMAAVCSDDKNVYLDNAEYLKDYEKVLDAYFSRVPIEKATAKECNILLQCYGPIALAAGLERADELKSLYYDQTLLKFQVKAIYCSNNGLFQELLSEDEPDMYDTLSDNSVINCLIMAGRCEEAYSRIASNFDKGRVSGVLLQYLSAAASRLSGQPGKDADRLYQRYIKAYDNLIRVQDMLNSGYVPDESNNKKMLKPYKSLNVTQFKKQLEEETAKPYIDGFFEICDKTAEMLEGRGLSVTAMELRRYLFAKSYNKAENREKLVSFFEKVGNQKMVGELCKEIYI